MNDILIVTGTCGVGKSSLCRAWADQRNGAIIHCDSFRTWIRDPSVRPFRSTRSDGYQERLLAKHASSLAADYLAMGLDVAIDNVWTPAGLRWLEEKLSDRGRINVFWLNCSAEENHMRDGLRRPSDVMGSRVDELQQELDAMNWPSSVVRLETSGQTVAQTLDRIETLLGCKRTNIRA